MIRTLCFRLVAVLAVALGWSGRATADSITHFDHDAAGQVTREYVEDTVTGEVLTEKRLAYDNLGRLWRVRQLAEPDGPLDDAADRIIEIGSDQAGNETSRRRRATTGDAVTTYTYDFANRRTSMTDAEGGVTSYDHDGRGNVTCVVDPVGNETYYVFDAGGREILEEQHELNGDTLTPILRIVREYDGHDNKIRETAYDLVDDPDLPLALTQRRWSFDEFGRLESEAWMMDPASEELPAVYHDRVFEYEYSAGSDRVFRKYTYDSALTDPAIATAYTQYDYDPLGRLASIWPQGLSGSWTLQAYDLHGQIQIVTRAESPLPQRQMFYFYTDFGSLREEKAPGPPVLRTLYEYDGLNRRTRKTDPAGIVTCYEYDSFGDQATIIEDCFGATPRVTEFGYDQLGHLAWRRALDSDGPAQTTIFAHDLLGRRTGITFCDTPPSSFLYEYDAAGRMITRVDPLARTATYTFDHHGHVLTKTVDEVLEETFVYNPLGWVRLAARGPDDHVVFEYDAFGLAIAETQTIGGTSRAITYGYSESGLPVEREYPADVGVNVAYSYDALARVTDVYRNGVELAAYSHGGPFVTERRITTKNADDTAVSLGISYDNHRRQALLHNTVYDQWVHPLDRYEYTHDNVGNVETAEITGAPAIQASVDYGYDGLHRLTLANYTDTAELFSHDELGNRQSYDDRLGGDAEYDHDCVNEYTAIAPGPYAPVYDAAGNLTRNEYGYGLAYDYENRLVEVRDPADAVLASWTYDALGRRVAETRGGETTRFYYDDHNVIAEYDGYDRLARYYVHGPAYVDEHVLLHDAARGDLYYLNTALFSTSGLVDRFGNVLERYSYDAYGLPAVHADDLAPDLAGDLNGDGVVDEEDFVSRIGTCAGDPYYDPAANFDDSDACINFLDYQLWLQLYRAYVNPNPDNPYYFTGRRLDFDLRDEDGSVTGVPGTPLLTLYHYRARAYDPWHGRFLQRDPALYRDGSNLYEYCRSNPLLCTDPTGQYTLLDLLSSFGAIGSDLRARTAAYSLSAYGLAHSVAQAISFRNQVLTNIIDNASRMGSRGVDYLIRATQVMQGAAGRAFNANTYREGYIWLRGAIGQGMQVHHIFPQKFVEFFTRKGINIHVPLWLEEIEAGAHAHLTYAYNAAWTTWISKNPNATLEEVMCYARTLMSQVFGVSTTF